MKLNGLHSSNSIHFLSLEKPKKFRNSNSELIKIQRKDNKIGRVLLKSRERIRQGSMDLYRGPIGTEAKIDFYESYKKLPLITERNKFENIEENPNIAYLQEISKHHLSPLPFGVVRPSGSEKSMDLSGKCIGDNYAQALSEGLKHIDNIEFLNLQDNRLTEAGVNSILLRMNFYKLKELNLANNRLGKRSFDLLSSIFSDKDSVLSKINLENVSTKEIYFAQLISSLKLNNMVTQLVLAKNSLGELAAISLKELLQTNNFIKKIDLHWNKLNSSSGLLIFEGLKTNRSLQELDLSWNSIGGNHSTYCISRIAEILSAQKDLKHLDFSYNYLTIEESEAFGEKLNSNHTLLGLHMEGNNCYVDSNGFLAAKKSKKIKAGLLFKRIFQGKKKTSNCWVCGKWVEVTFKIRSNNSGQMRIHIDIDNFSPYLMLRKGTKLEITRALPPKKKILFFFSRQNQANFSNVYPVCELDVPYGHTFEDSSTIILKQMNYIVPKGVELNVKNPFSTKPRTRFSYENTKEERIAWSFGSSVFKDYVVDSSSLLADCFDYDWSSSKLDGLVKNLRDKQKTKHYLKSVYEKIRLCYKSLSSFGSTEVFSVGSNVMTDFLNECGIIDSLYSIHDFGVNWNSTNVTTQKDMLYNPGNSLVRYEFMEILVRIAYDKYLKTKKCKSLRKSTKTLIEEFLIPAVLKNGEENSIKAYNTNAWRVKEYFCEDVDLTLKIYKPVLEAVYKKYSGKKNLPGCKKFMCIDEFNDLCKDSGLACESISSREINFCFVQSMMTQIDEYYKKRHFEMKFVEFLEAVSRVIDMKDADSERTLQQKLENSLKNLILLCPKSVAEVFHVPTAETFHQLKYKIIKV